MTEEIQKETEQKISHLQLLEQSLQNFLVQKQQFQAQFMEISSALEELKTANEAYKIVGNIMVKATKDDLEKDLNRKKEMIELRIKTLEKQEAQIREKASKMQSEVVKELKTKK